MFTRLGALLRRPEIKTQSRSRVSLTKKSLTHPLFVLSLLGHLVPKVSQLSGELLHQLLGLIQLALKGFQLVLLSISIFHLQGNGSQAWEPVKASVLHHGVDVALWTGELCWVFHLYQDDEPKIVPHVVFLVDMILKGHILVVKVFPLKTADEASVLLDLLRIVLL